MEFFYLVWFYGVWKWHIHLIFIKDMMMILESSSWQLIEEVEIEFEKLRRDWFNLEIEEFGILNYAFLDFTNSIIIYEYTFSFSIQFLYAGFLKEVSYGAVRIVIGVYFDDNLWWTTNGIIWSHREISMWHVVCMNFFISHSCLGYEWLELHS